jgi:hypothetical protein
MSDTIIVALITLVGTFGGIMTSSRLTGYRIEQLEKKVEAMSELVVKSYKLEEQSSIQDERLNILDKRVDKLERLHEQD